MLLHSRNVSYISTRSTARQGRKQVAIHAVQLRTPYESASFDDWEVRAEIEEQIKRKQARKTHEARRRGATVERRQGAQRFFAAEQAAYRERRAREEAHMHYLDSVAVCLEEFAQTHLQHLPTGTRTAVGAHSQPAAPPPPQPSAAAERGRCCISVARCKDVTV